MLCLATACQTAAGCAMNKFYGKIIDEQGELVCDAGVYGRAKSSYTSDGRAYRKTYPIYFTPHGDGTFTIRSHGEEIDWLSVDIVQSETILIHGNGAVSRRPYLAKYNFPQYRIVLEHENNHE